jgi:hypothetical protein
LRPHFPLLVALLLLLLAAVALLLLWCVGLPTAGPLQGSRKAHGQSALLRQLLLLLLLLNIKRDWQAHSYHSCKHSPMLHCSQTSPQPDTHL